MMATRREIIFEEEIQLYGRPLLLNQVPPIFQEFRNIYAHESARILRETQQSPGHGGPLKYLFAAFINNLSLDSVAFRREGEHYIALFAGAFLILYDTFSTILSHPRVLTDIGDPSNELLVNKPFGDAIKLDYGEHADLSLVINEQLFRHVPVDNARKSYALTLARIALVSCAVSSF